MPTCRDYDPLLESFADGEIGGESLAALRGHLDTCAACRRELRLRTRLKLRIAGDAFPPLDAGVREEILRGPARPAPRRTAIAIAALVIVAAAATALVLATRRGDPAPTPTVPPPASPSVSPSLSPAAPIGPVSRGPIGLLSLIHRQVLAGEVKWPIVEFKTAAEVATYLQLTFGETLSLPDPPESGWSLTHVGHRGICPDCARSAGGDLRQTYIQALDGLFPAIPAKTWIMLKTEGPLISCIVFAEALPLPGGRPVARGSLHRHGRNAVVVQRTKKLTILWIAEAEDDVLLKALGN